MKKRQEEIITIQDLRNNKSGRKQADNTNKKTAKTGKAAKGAGTDKASKKTKTGKAAKGAKPDKTAPGTKSAKSGKAGKPVSSEKAGSTERNGKPILPEIIAKAEKVVRPEKAGKAARVKKAKKASVSKKLLRKQENREKNRPSLFTLQEAERAKERKLIELKQDIQNQGSLLQEGFGGSAENSAAVSASYIMAIKEDRRQRELSELAKKRASSLIPDRDKKIKIIFLGGLEQIGMNITAFESDNSIVVVDCGMAFPNEDMLGIDLVIPDITYLKERATKVEGFFITHGHEDHIGALPYVLKELNVPVYATRLTRALIENKLREAELLDSAKLRTVEFGDFVGAGDFTVEFIKTNHSIQDAAALAIHTPAGVILHTGDFKVDYTPVFGDTIDLQRFAELGKNGVLALLCDSTNAVRQGFTMSERTVGKTFEAIFAEHTDKRIIVATFASNVDRVQQVINAAEKHDRKVVIDGRSMVNVIGTASELGYIQLKEGTLIDIAQIRNYPPEKTVLVVTGSQGESMAALSRMATGQHRKVSLSEKDVIIMSSTPIPGNEKAVSRVINELSRRHTKVIYQDTHVSGHACVEELKLIYALVHPKFSIPVHGEFRHRLAQREVALAIGVPKPNVLMAETGDVVEISPESCEITDHVQAGPIMVDGLGVGDVGNIVLRDRQSLSQNGIIIVVLAVEAGSGQLIGGPEIVTRGFVYVRENEDLIEESKKVILESVNRCMTTHNGDWAHMKNVVRDDLDKFIWHRMKRTPMILPIISEV
ncbi:MAG: ribonuclease J [Lachnospiraceae bacterium]|nr:ribonuclease J [Lachnospiraceae bacterium]